MSVLDDMALGTRKYHAMIKKLCEPLKQYYGITEMGYVEIENSGRIINLHTHHDWLENCMDKKYFIADVVNHNDYLEIFSDKVKNPAYVRYAWSDTSYASFFNSDGLPASSFNSENEFWYAVHNPFFVSERLFKITISSVVSLELHCIGSSLSIAPLSLAAENNSLDTGLYSTPRTGNPFSTNAILTTK